ncbi:MAG: hypothetical protein KDE09_00485 [Anaerolineales bacterium]|nr:hypothetical protein [Anaerolineales bacterium]MCB0026723.1 hypothetical protein [Anaerolineales bacterium]
MTDISKSELDRQLEELYIVLRGAFETQRSIYEYLELFNAKSDLLLKCREMFLLGQFRDIYRITRPFITFENRALAPSSELIRDVWNHGNFVPDAAQRVLNNDNEHVAWSNPLWSAFFARLQLWLQVTSCKLTDCSWQFESCREQLVLYAKLVASTGLITIFEQQAPPFLYHLSIQNHSSHYCWSEVFMQLQLELSANGGTLTISSNHSNECFDVRLRIPASTERTRNTPQLPLFETMTNSILLLVFNRVIVTRQLMIEFLYEYSRSKLMNELKPGTYSWQFATLIDELTGKLEADIDKLQDWVAEHRLTPDDRIS